MKIEECRVHEWGLEKGPFGPHWGKSTCVNCGKFLRWESRPFGWAPETPMPYGKHKGTPVKDLPADYCAWLLGASGTPKGLKSYLLQKDE